MLHLLRLRALATAELSYDLHRAAHELLDPRLSHLAVEVGASSAVDYAQAFIVSRFCRLLEPHRVLEIGTRMGGITRHLARNTPDSCRIWTLEPTAPGTARPAEQEIEPGLKSRHAGPL